MLSRDISIDGTIVPPKVHLSFEEHKKQTHQVGVKVMGSLRPKLAMCTGFKFTSVDMKKTQKQVWQQE